jgi:hypothetical protein
MRRDNRPITLKENITDFIGCSLFTACLCVGMVIISESPTSSLLQRLPLLQAQDHSMTLLRQEFHQAARDVQHLGGHVQVLLANGWKGLSVEGKISMPATPTPIQSLSTADIGDKGFLYGGPHKNSIPHLAR